MIRIGVDLGGTKIEAIALGDADAVLARERVPTPVGDYDATIVAVRDLVLAIERRVTTSNDAARPTVGVGTPGSISQATGRIQNANSTVLNGRPLEIDLAASLGLPVRIANDANCFALSEAIDGAGAGAHCVVGVILGTGVGGGIVIDGTLHAGRHGIAGEWGHAALPWIEPADHPSRACWCGRRNCVETWLSGPALAADHGASSEAAHLDAAAVADAAHRGDPRASASLARYARRLAKALGAVIDVLDPDVIVLGGGVSNIDALYASVPPLLAEFVFCDAPTTPIVRARHGDSSGVRGAARLWPA